MEHLALSGMSPLNLSPQDLRNPQKSRQKEGISQMGWRTPINQDPQNAHDQSSHKLTKTKSERTGPTWVCTRPSQGLHGCAPGPHKACMGVHQVLTVCIKASSLVLSYDCWGWPWGRLWFLCLLLASFLSVSVLPHSYVIAFELSYCILVCYILLFSLRSWFVF